MYIMSAITLLHGAIDHSAAKPSTLLEWKVHSRYVETRLNDEMVVILFHAVAVAAAASCGRIYRSGTVVDSLGGP